MKNILFIPLDERPCNYDFPKMMVQDTGYRLIMPDREILGKKKQAGDIEKIWDWFYENAGNCGSAVISVDMLLYSGIVPSRLHHYKVSDLMQRLERLRVLKKQNPSLRIYAFSLIMRNPTYSSSEEEPDYYGRWGRDIFLYGCINHKKELNIASAEELKELKRIEEELPEDCLSDYLERRKINIEVNKKVVEMAEQGIFDFVIIPQDDSSEYGLTAKDQQVIRSLINKLHVNLKVYMYPDADAVANTLIARIINKSEGKIPLVYIKYASCIGNAVVPVYEDRIVGETIKYQILAAGGMVASSAAEAQIILMVNVPGGKIQDLLDENTNMKYGSRLPSYYAGRTLIELIEYAGYAVKNGKNVVIADIAYGNGGEPLLLDLLRQKGIEWKLAGYAGWNTSSNSLGTCIPMGMIYNIFGDTDAHRNFLALRYVEDIGYCAIVRQDVTKNCLPAMKLNFYNTDGQRGKAAELVKEKLQKFADDYLGGGGYKVSVDDCYLPWSRMFEVGLKVSVKPL